jgi:nucleoid DNA-binding protein
MATRIEAISKFRPKVDLARTVSTAELSEYIAGRTGLNRGEIQNVLAEFNEAIIFFARQGMAVKIDELGIFWPKIKLTGQLRERVKLDRSVNKALNVDGAYTGGILNRENIGKSVDELVEMWNAENPDDPID